jgi:hypothetical protein
MNMPTTKKNKSVRRTAQPARLDADRSAEPLTRLVAKVPVGERFVGSATHFEGADGTRVPLRFVQVDDPGYEPFLRRIRDSIEMHPAGTPIFTTEDTRPPSSGSAMDTFLEMLPVGEFRQHYNCRACASFLNKYAGLVTIGEHGELRPVIWRSHFPGTGIPGNIFGGVWSRFLAETSSGYRKVTGVFFSEETEWGDTGTSANPKLGFTQRHMSLTPPKDLVYSNKLKTAEQAMAEKKEEYRMLQRGLARFDRWVVDKAVAWLRAWKLSGDRVEHSHMAEWLLSLILCCASQPPSRRENLVWLAVAKAPVGYCHFSSGALGSLLEKILQKFPMDQCREAYAQMLNPLKYQRPQAAPAAGNVRAAEKTVERLGIERSLERRFAHLEELTPAWKTPGVETARPDRAGPFGAFSAWAKQIQEVAQNSIAPQRLPPTAMTWEKFRRETLPYAKKIECLVPMGRANFTAFVTAKHLDAPPILRWDSAGRRNPVSYYVYHNGSLASDWGLQSRMGYYVDVKAVVDHPATWGSDSSPTRTHSKEAFLILSGCYDALPRGGLGLFPEILSPDLHEVRATIESYSQSHRLQPDPQSAAGLHVVGNTLVVFTAYTRQQIKIDRWD